MTHPGAIIVEVIAFILMSTVLLVSNAPSLARFTGIFAGCLVATFITFEAPFSGMSMENDFKVMREWAGPGLPFPKVQRRPDFRSSGPKRLMPQLQVKVPTISRWGKKMAVIIDKSFWDSLSEMRETRDLSNSEIVWFVVRPGVGQDGRFTLQRHEVHYTTLTNAVEGLTGGTPMSLDRFEREIRDRLSLS